MTYQLKSLPRERKANKPSPLKIKMTHNCYGDTRKSPDLTSHLFFFFCRYRKDNISAPTPPLPQDLYILKQLITNITTAVTLNMLHKTWEEQVPYH